MRRLLLLLLVGAVVGGLVVVDVAARRFAEDQVAAVVQANVAGGSATSVRVRAFPFLPSLLTAGRVSRIEVTQRAVAAGALVLDEVVVDVHEVDLDRNRLLQREAVVKSIDSGTVRAVLGEAALSAATGVAVELRPGGASATVAGRSIEVGIAVTDGMLTLSPAAGPAIQVPIPVLPLLPCVSAIHIRDGMAVLTCRFDEVPPGLLARTTIPG